MSTSGGSSGGGGSLTAVKKAMSATASDISTSSATPAEIDASLRLAITVGASGSVVLLQSCGCHGPGSTATDFSIYYSLDGTTWVQTGSMAFANANPEEVVEGSAVISSAAGNQLTIRMGWALNSGSTPVTIPSQSRGAAPTGVWQLAITV